MGKPGKMYLDEDMEIFISRAMELKEEGNKVLRYDKAVKLLPKDHMDVAYLRTCMASCYMRMGLGEYPKAISECNLALEASPRYSKALLRRARCYEALNKLDYAFRDARVVLNMEPENVSGNEVFGRVKKVLAEKGVDVEEMERSFANVQPVGAARLRKKKKKKNDEKKGEEVKSPKVEKGDEAAREDKRLEKKISFKNDKGGKGQKKKKSGNKVVVMDKEVIASEIVFQAGKKWLLRLLGLSSWCTEMI